MKRTIGETAFLCDGAFTRDVAGPLESGRARGAYTSLFLPRRARTPVPFASVEMSVRRRRRRRRRRRQ